MKTRIPTTHILEDGRKVVIPADLKTIRASNLPADSIIKYWLAELPENLAADSQIESHFRNIGFGILASDVSSY